MSVTDPRPAPYPADTRAKGWNFGMDVDRIHRSDTWALCADSGGGIVCGVHLLMLLEAWQQVPCGTMPNDDEAICKLLKVGQKFFAKHRRALMYEWSLASDGRYYIPILTSQVMEMINRRAHAWRAFRAEVIDRCGAKCWYCAAANIELTMDHVIPRSRGGTDDPGNLVPACRSCNSSKGARTPEEWKGAR